MYATPKSRDDAPRNNNNPYAATLPNQPTAQLNPSLIIFESDRKIAARSISRPKPKCTPTTAAEEIMDSFLASLRYVPTQNVFRNIGSEFISKFSRYYNESKSILKQSANTSLIPNNYTVVFPFQVPEKMKDDPGFKKVLQEAKDGAAEATKTNHVNYLKVVRSANQLWKNDLKEFIALSLPEMSNIVLITHNAAEYGAHNLVADVLMIAHQDVLRLWCNLESFVEIYKRVNQCGRIPEDAKTILDRMTPAAKAAPAAASKTAPVNSNKSPAAAPIPPTPILAPATGNLKDVNAIYGKDEETSAISDGSSLPGFFNASALLLKMQEQPGVDVKILLQELAKKEAEAASNQGNLPPTSITAPITAPSEGASVKQAPQILSPLRALRQRETSKLYFSRKYSQEEVEALMGIEEENSQIFRCKRLALLDSIRDDNYVEGSRLASVRSDPKESAAKRLFTSLEEVEYTPFDHPQAVQDLLDAALQLFSHTRSAYINQYLYNLTVKDLKKTQVKYSYSTSASQTTNRMATEFNSAHPPTSEKTIDASLDSKLHKKMVQYEQDREDSDDDIYFRLAALEDDLNTERAQRKKSEQELLRLKSTLESKEEVPNSNSGTETIELDPSESPPPKQPKVKFQEPPPNKFTKNSSNRHKNIHARAKKRHQKQNEATDADSDTSQGNSDSSKKKRKRNSNNGRNRKGDKKRHQKNIPKHLLKRK